jgi:hypothetical protein
MKFLTGQNLVDTLRELSNKVEYILWINQIKNGELKTNKTKIHIYITNREGIPN